MATFKVGQRVKRIRSKNTDPKQCSEIPIGAEGTVDCMEGAEWVTVRWDREYPTLQFRGTCSWVYSWSITPILPPDEKADAFIESLKQMKPYMEPTVIPARVKA